MKSPECGGPEGDRTLDLTDANRTLSQLSYAPTRRTSLYHIFFICKELFFINNDNFLKMNSISVFLI